VDYLSTPNVLASDARLNDLLLDPRALGITIAAYYADNIGKVAWIFTVDLKGDRVTWPAIEPVRIASDL
jgi:hypothetical protein